VKYPYLRTPDGRLLSGSAPVLAWRWPSGQHLPTLRFAQGRL